MNSWFCRLVASLILIMAYGAVAATARAAPINPTADAMLSAKNSTNNYGGAGSLEISPTGATNGEFQSVLQFDLSTTKTGFDGTFGVGLWSVSSISLQLTATSGTMQPTFFNPSAAGQLAFSWMQNDSWTEGTGTPNVPGALGITFSTLSSFLSAGDQSLGTFSFDGSTSGNFNYNLSLASGITGDVTSGSAASIRIFANDSTVSALFNSRSFGTTSFRPLLTVTAAAVPEPASAILAALAFVGLAWFRWRRDH